MERKHILNVFFLFSLMVLTACSGFSCRQAPPSIFLFTATPAEINSGASSTLKWDVTDATSVSIDQGIGEVAANGSKELSPSKTTAYTLTATNAGGTLTKALVLYVKEPPPTPSLPVADTTPPVIKDVSTSSETETGVTITWTTNEPASSNVEYGKETDYGLSVSLPGLSTAHSIILSDLEPNAAYHFRVKSSDEAGNQASSDDNIFATAQEKSPYSLALQSLEWGRRAENISLGMGDEPVEGKKYLYIKGTLQNRSQGSLRAVICTMNCWSGNTIVKYQVYVHRSSVLPGQVFLFNIETADDPTVDNVTIDFADSMGRDIVVTKEQ
ncbi:MAG: fibronectin type III domain-containing protein [Dehalococcoidia bacterium]|nr:fibronectin type III domain-containing protein [Dehalococcoidia bacterium]